MSNMDKSSLGKGFSETKYCKMNLSCKDLEMQWLSVTPNNVRPILVVNVYRPPQGDYKKCCELLIDAFNRADLKDNTEIYILGDLI